MFVVTHDDERRRRHKGGGGKDAVPAAGRRPHVMACLNGARPPPLISVKYGSMPACGWVLDNCPCGSTPWSSYSAEVRLVASTLAAHHMWAATGRRYGLCPVTVMPCNPLPVEPLYQVFPVELGTYSDENGGLHPYMAVGGEWRNACSGGCTCRAACEVELEPPVADTPKPVVMIDGVVIPSSAYHVQSRRLLVRTDGTCWPTCVTFGAAVPGFQVSYSKGDPIPPAVTFAAEKLACEYAAACVSGPCALPERLTSLTRQGVSVEVAADNDDVWTMLTGIPLVDRVIASENPGRLHSRPLVLSPDQLEFRTITSP